MYNNGNTSKNVTGASVVDGTIANADIDSSAAIATSKLSGAVTSITSHGLSSSATTDTTDASNIGSGTLPNARLSAVPTSSLTGAVTSIASHGLASSATTDTTDASNISSGTLPAARIATDGLSGDKIDGGTISNFASTGIDDNATSNKVTLDNNRALLNNALVVDKTNNGYSGTKIHDDSGGDYNSYIDMGRNQGGTRLWIRRGARVQGTTPWTDATPDNVCSFAYGGISFGSDTAAANTLDDYEEGTWTPSIADASSGGNENALSGTFNYTKIGNTVHLWGLASNFSTAGLTAGNNVYVTGLPFTSGSETPCSIWWQNMNINNTGMIVPRISNGYSIIRFDELVDNANDEVMIVSDFASGTVDFRIQATYKV